MKSMLERVAKALLEQFLGDYIDIDSKSLLLALWSGNLELHDIKIKNTAINAFDLPIIITHAHVGELHVSIPWRSLQSSAVVASLSDVYFIIQPRKCKVWDEHSERERQKVLKKRILKNYEAALLQPKEPEKSAEDQKSFGEGFIARLVQIIINNLQVHVRNIHFRYEDDSDPHHPIIFGVSLESLDVKTCDENWQEAFLNTTEQHINKLISLRGLAAYVNIADTEILSHSSDKTASFINERMKKSITDDGRNFIIEPIYAEAKIKMQKIGKRLDFTQPQMHIELSFDRLSLNLHVQQYRDVLETIEYLTKFRAFEKYGSSRPLVLPTDEASRHIWLRYALASIQKEFEEKIFDWTQVQTRSRQRTEYMALYKKSKTKIDKFERERMEQLESELDIDSLLKQVFLFLFKITIAKVS